MIHFECNRFDYNYYDRISMEEAAVWYMQRGLILTGVKRRPYMKLRPLRIGIKYTLTFEQPTNLYSHEKSINEQLRDALLCEDYRTAARLKKQIDGE